MSVPLSCADTTIAAALRAASRPRIKSGDTVRVLGSGLNYVHHATAAARQIAERNVSARLSYRVAMRRKSLRRQNIRSIRLRALYSLVSYGMGLRRDSVEGMTARAPCSLSQSLSRFAS